VATTTAAAAAATAAIIDESATAKAMMASVALLHSCGSGTFYAHVMPFPSVYLTFSPYLSLSLMDVWRMHEARSTASG
jgi:hypothetical protein